jgi:hypothetical protein
MAKTAGFANSLMEEDQIARFCLYERSTFWSGWSKITIDAVFQDRLGINAIGQAYCRTVLTASYINTDKCVGYYSWSWDLLWSRLNQSIIRRSRLYTEPQSTESAPSRTPHRMTQENGDAISSLANRNLNRWSHEPIPRPLNIVKYSKRWFSRPCHPAKYDGRPLWSSYDSSLVTPWSHPLN